MTCLSDLGEVHPLVFIQIKKKQIELAKEIYILDIEQGQEVFILPELGQQKLPESFKFYDPILKIIQEKCDIHRKEIVYQ